MKARIEKQKENVANLLELIKANPDLEILPMVDGEICGDNCMVWAASWGEARVDEYYIDDERIYFLDEVDHLIEREIDLSDDDTSDEEAERQAKAAVDAYEWKKAIIVMINPR